LKVGGWVEGVHAREEQKQQLSMSYNVTCGQFATESRCIQRQSASIHSQGTAVKSARRAEGEHKPRRSCWDAWTVLQPCCACFVTKSARMPPAAAAPG
jgi:hypothetical protein